MTQKTILSILLIFCSFQIFAQYTITGTVINKITAEPLGGVNVLVNGKNDKGTITNSKGKYWLELNKEETFLLFRYEGYLSSTIRIDTAKKVHDVELDVLMLFADRLDVSADGDYIEDGDVAYYIEPKSEVRYDAVKSARSMEKTVLTSRETEAIVSSAYSSDKSTSRVMEISEYSIKGSSIKSGTLTAGEIHDFSKWELWEDIAENELKQYKETWNTSLKNRYSIQVINKAGVPIVDGEVRILNKEKEVLWTSRTDNTGKAELWLNVFDNDRNLEETYEAEVTYNGKTHKIENLKTFHDGVNTLKIRTKCNIPNQVDVMFVVDATSSMSDEILYLKIELADVIQRMQQENDNLEINLGSVFYRDHSDSYLTRKSDFTADVDKALAFIKTQNASGGGDRPEAVEYGLDEAINNMVWSENAVARLLFLVLDAPPHQNEEVQAKLEELILKASKKGIRIIPVTCSGVDKSTEYLMRSLALGTNGTYTFLTDHSGVGNSHIEPTTDSYKVEKFNDLLVRLYKQYTVTPSCKGDLVYTDDEVEEVKKEDDEETISLSYYPNPTKGNLTIEIDEAIEEVFITDANGKIIQRHINLPIGKTRIDLNEFPSGMYFLRYVKGEQSGTKKIILIH